MKKTKLTKISLIILESEQEQGNAIRPPAHESESLAQLPRPRISNVGIDQLSTLTLPIIPVEHATNRTRDQQQSAGMESPVTVLRKLVKSSGIYALSSVVSPLVSLVLAPFLTHNLSATDYGTLTILNLFISLAAGISQLGLGSAFFRAYGYDYTESNDQRDVLSTASMLLCLISVPVTIGVMILAPVLATLLFSRPALSGLVAIAGVVILLQNLTVPGFSWLRAESRPLFYSLLSISNLLITLIATIVLVGVLHLGIVGSLIANGCGYAIVIICIMPITLLRAGVKIRIDIAWSMLAFGLPLVLNFVSYWILQLSDRFLLSRLSSLAETARYAVAYTLGTAMGVLVMGPFTLAWPTAMFAIAKREDAVAVFRLVFRWFSLILLFIAFGLSIVSTVLLDWLFPKTYHSAAPVIPIVAESIAFYGVYYVFMVGANIKRKTWLTGVFTTIAAILNVGFNLILIPNFGLMGAALSTLLAYVALASVAYVVNQRIYPIPFEIHIFVVALVLGTALYIGGYSLERALSTDVSWGISFCALCLYGGSLALLVRLPTPSHLNKQ